VDVGDRLRQLDRAGVEALQSLHGTPLDALFRLLNPLWLVALLGLVGVLLAVRERHDLLPVLAVAVAWPCEALTVALLKRAVGRPRPPLADPSLHPLVALPNSSSFPSGHAAAAFAFAVALSLLAPRLRWLYLAVATLVAVSRVWLGVHYPSDVLAGALVGGACGWLGASAARAYDSWRRR
jgi:undecaprenyl-diphosphatase